MTKLPKRVVRFYGNVDYALDAIGTRQITFIHAAQLNDPFDPYVFLETDFQEDSKALFDYVCINHPDDFGWFLQEGHIENWQDASKSVRAYFDILRE